jgi:LYR motif-containing protein 4
MFTKNATWRIALDTARRETMSGSTLKLYRHILKAAKSFPSKNRNGLIEEIKTEFRENAGATDAGDVQKKIALARDGLDRMRAFTGLDQGSSKWDVSLKGPFDGT